MLGDDIHKKDGKADLILCISHTEILLEASNTSVSCNRVTSVVRSIPRSNPVAFTNIGSILKGDQTQRTIRSQKGIPKSRRNTSRISRVRL